MKLPPAFDGLNVGVTLHAPDTGEILDVNDRLERLYGYPSSDLQSMTVEDYSAPSTRFTQEEAVKRIRSAAAGDPQSFEWQIVRANGDIRWVRVHLNAATLDGEKCVLAEIRDITESRVRERRLGLLSRILRHNLRNRSTVLIGVAEYLEDEVEDETLEDQIETLLEISREIGSLSDSVTQLEEIVELDVDDRSPHELRDLVRSLASDLDEEYPHLDVTIDAPAELWVMADAGLEYALEHALENAVEHNPHENPTVAITVEERPTLAEIRITDDGPLIPQTEIAVLDEDVETSSTYHGSGVGLWIMQWAVSSLGGELTFDENPTGGNTITFTLPKGAPP